MTGAMLYGFLLGVLFVALDVLGNRMAWACFWAAQAVFLAVYTRLVWQRTRLFWMAEGGAHATVIAAALIPASLAGYTIRNLPSPWQLIFWINTAALPISHVIARYAHRAEFGRLKQHMQDMSLWDMLRFRHIPHLR